MSKAMIAAVASVIPAMVIGSVAGGLAGGATAIASGSIANACGASNETADTTASIVGSATYYGVGLYTTCKIVGAVYDAFNDE